MVPPVAVTSGASVLLDTVAEEVAVQPAELVTVTI
jgi:hypothetical protein